MSYQDEQERRRRLALRRIGEIQSRLGRSPTELELRTAAQAFGVADYLPEPQRTLEFAH